MSYKDRFDGTAARQLALTDDAQIPLVDPSRPGPTRRPELRLLQKDVYAELARRRRRAQIAARRWIE